jgi:hypothetical protein
MFVDNTKLVDMVIVGTNVDMVPMISQMLLKISHTTTMQFQKNWTSMEK